MKIALAQMDPVVGSFEANVRKITEAYQRACSDQARLLLTPELSVSGYPPHDLLDRPEIFERNERAIQDLLPITRNQSCALIIGYVAKNPSAIGRSAQNMAAVIENGAVVFRQAKTLLPTYDVFDEARYFEPSSSVQPWVCDGKRIALAICEDLWSHHFSGERQLYGRDPITEYKQQGVDLVLSLSASPYEFEKRPKREGLHAEVARDLGAPLIYLNQVGATDEVLFDGSSFVLDAEGKLVGRLAAFRTGYGVVEVSGEEVAFTTPSTDKDREDQYPNEIEILHRGLVTGIREYFHRTTFRTAVIGLSGGIDSAVVAALAAQALGPKNVLGVAMPSQYSSSHSLEDAESLAHRLGIRFEVRPIKFLFSAASRELSEFRGELAPIALENMQARLRALVLMTLSNHYSSLVLTTGNKSELAMGYCTLYGDMVGALNPIGDLFKTRVYALARFINLQMGGVIPERSIQKAPSAELRPNQKDQDTLPKYEILDPLLKAYIEDGWSVEKLAETFSEELKSQPLQLEGILRKVELNEYKRRQAAPILKISRKAFGIGRRIPIAKHWDQFC